MTEAVVEGDITSVEHSMENKKLLEGVVSQVENRIGRPSGSREKRALGFLIGQSRFGQRDNDSSESFLSSVCAVEDTDSSRNVAIKILKTVITSVVSEYKSRLDSAAGNAEEEGRLESINTAFIGPLGDRLQRVQENPAEEVHFSGVPGYWIPQWVPVM
jgi:hypothetical protein